MKQTISKDGVVLCVSDNKPYSPETIKQLKKAGYKIKTEGDTK